MGYSHPVEFEQPEQNTMAILASKITASNLADVRVFTVKDGEIIAIGRPSPNTGRFVTIVAAGEEYDIVATLDTDTLRQHVSTLKSQSYHLLQQPVAIEDFVFEDKPNEAFVNNESLTANTGSTIDGDDLPYTVQIMSLRKTLDPKLIRGNLEKDKITEYRYNDGWFVYSYGSYKTFSQALKAQKQIRKTTPYSDAFARNKKQYEKFTKESSGIRNTRQ